MTGADLALHGDDERAWALLMNRARVIAKMKGLKTELAGDVDSVAGVMISLQQQGLPITVLNINDAFDFIQGRIAQPVQTKIALAYRAGYDITPVVRTNIRAVARIEGPDIEPTEVEFAVQDAIDAERLDEWVEKVSWETYEWQGQTRRRKAVERVVVRRNGVPVDDRDLPAWAQQEMAAGRVKRLDAWWMYRTDMLWKSAVNRAIKMKAGHVLLGIDRPRPDGDRPRFEPAADPVDPYGGEPIDDDVVDAELVDAELVDDEISSRPASPASPQAQAGTADAAGARPAPAGEQLFDDDPGRPFS